MWATCVFAVCSLTTSVAAISWFDSPRARSLSTSSSRGVSCWTSGGGSARGDLRANCSISRRVTDGAKIEPPWAATRLVLWCVLDEESARACPQRLIDVLVEVEGGQHDHTRRRFRAVQDSTRGLETVKAWHTDVHENDVRLDLSRPFHRFEPVGGLTNHLQVVLGLKDHAESGADEPLVVSEKDPDGHDRPESSGRHARSVKPPPSLEPTSILPP